MRSHSIYNLHKKRHADKAAGVKRGPLHTLQECREEAGISIGKYNGYVRMFGNAPKPAVVAPGKGSTNRPTQYFHKADVLAWIARCRELEVSKLR